MRVSEYSAQQGRPVVLRRDCLLSAVPLLSGECFVFFPMFQTSCLSVARSLEVHDVSRQAGRDHRSIAGCLRALTSWLSTAVAREHPAVVLIYENTEVHSTAPVRVKCIYGLTRDILRNNGFDHRQPSERAGQGHNNTRTIAPREESSACLLSIFARVLPWACRVSKAHKNLPAASHVYVSKQNNKTTIIIAAYRIILYRRYLDALSDGALQLRLSMDGDRVVKRASARAADGGFRDRSLSQLSGGQWRRASLSLELAFVELARQRGRFSCNLLVLDEVLSQLDSRGRERVRVVYVCLLVCFACFQRLCVCVGCCTLCRRKGVCGGVGLSGLRATVPSLC